ncbi:RNA-directed DNA polymerase [Desertifilum sp. FACHB-1129]|uniref:RNA-dependent DNA polymerase n=1 Tax=Desertifilum tharense IPPAS B-1220 TaxID=1781255 RepID=A0A1E5QK68_9CYAN|nr:MULTISPECIES: RNA-directed DNA polymerase [unclassified Desertifilum]MDA0211800.1 RNA-directed DNA polymerase [Cyanobacteria bacterium FC1]OEJ75072.1 RNA-dependent DNA polymerase [Desertifilum tharense IPPAS B-1220]MBD2312029.1 RNA-directed DNA polymerase [Desertifilum sp. FACHB-1129]MBD2322482.1 RNA-directed DNA polymerase [Desertifilum sp. FACHB-866]MBD2332645.1 RNA-directed DNA polymerase [Desertifilum sp. FACHB-868]
MKRYGNLYPQITEFSNFLLAARKAQKGKRFRENVLAFNYNLEGELNTLQSELTHKTYQPGTYRTFEIKEPKLRTVSAAPYRDRVVHHALCNIIVPLIEPSFTSSSYANRVGYGMHRALNRFVDHYRSHRYVLLCDIQKYFPSIDLEILKLLLRRKLKCQDTLWLLDTIIDNSNPQIPIIEHFPGDDLLTPLQRRKGLPIGNLTSQFFANVYLNGLDHFVAEELKINAYVRYVDDFALFANDWTILADARIAIEAYLTQLRLKIHPIKSQLFSTEHGANFLGFRVFPKRIRVRNENLRRGRRRLKKLKRHRIQGKITDTQVASSLQSWFAHLAYGNTRPLQRQIFTSLASARE